MTAERAGIKAFSIRFASVSASPPCRERAARCARQAGIVLIDEAAFHKNVGK
jgi:phage FluMu gp28-like protein